MCLFDFFFQFYCFLVLFYSNIFLFLLFCYIIFFSLLLLFSLIFLIIFPLFCNYVLSLFPIIFFSLIFLSSILPKQRPSCRRNPRGFFHQTTSEKKQSKTKQRNREKYTGFRDRKSGAVCGLHA